MKKMIFILSFLLPVPGFVNAQGKWELQKDGGWIKVYTRAAASGDIKEVRVLCTLNTTTGKLIKTLRDIPAYSDWVYSNKKSEILKTIDPNNVIYYTQSHLPWPLKDRDLVIELLIDPSQDVLNIKAKSIPDYLPLSDKYVRVPYSLATWKVKKEPKNKLAVDYTFSVNPGGSVPAWLVNATLTIGPFTSFVKLRDLLRTQN